MKLLILSYFTLYLVYQAQACPTYWTHNGGSCYRYIGLPQTFARAVSVCQMFTGCSKSSQGPGLGHLVSINTIEENQFVFSMLASNFGEIPPPPAWLGLSDANPQGEFMWADGTVPSSATFSAWRGGGPNQNNNRNCAIFAELILPRWIDLPCEEEFPYICEVPSSVMHACPDQPPTPASAPLRGPNQPPSIRYSAKLNTEQP